MLKRPLFALFRAAKRLIGGRYGRGFASAPVVGALFRRGFELLKPRGEAVARFRGMRLLADADDPAHAPLFLGAEYNGPEIDAAEKILQPGMTAVDIGANIGCFALAMARAVRPNGKVYAFEPEPSNLEKLRKNCSLNQAEQVIVEGKAVGDRNGKARLYLSGETAVAHPDGSESSDKATAVEAEMVTLDSYFGAEPPSIDLLKMDIQGGEAAALRGMRRALDASPQMQMIVELDPECLAAAGEDPEQFLRELSDLGFALRHISHERNAPERFRPVSPEQALAVCRKEGRHINLLCARLPGEKKNGRR